MENGTLTIVDLPPGRKEIPRMYVFDIKRDEKGRIIMYKCRLVTKGFPQVAGRDFSEVLAPVSKQASFRMMLALVASQTLCLHQMDIKTGFLSGELTEELYSQPPDGAKTGGTNGKVWRLHKALYGLKQAARAWHLKLQATLAKLGFQPTHKDVSLYV